jgi:ribosomal protein S18 acetylase RimI-like enzyme
MEMQIDIVRAVESDLAAISSLAGQIWRTYYPSIITEEQIDYMLKRMYDVRVMREEFSAGVRYERILVDGAMIGFAAWGPAADAGACKLHKLYILGVWQGRGIGTRALAHIMKEAKAAAFSVMTLNVNKNNLLAITAYQRSGFEIAAEVCDDIGGGFFMDDYVMTRELGS